MIPTLMVESKEELKNLLMRVKESEKAGLKLNIQKAKIMTSGPMTSCQIDGETIETVTDFIFLARILESDSHSVMPDSVNPWTAAHQVPLSMGFSRQEYWNGLPFFLQGIFPTQGSSPRLWHCHVLKNFPQFVVIHTVKLFSVVNEKVDFLKNSLAFSVI